ncbi:MAG TPA: hypothetical protein VFT67_11560 [Jatrophihabitantaceae bacterium]|nr:hypothetical protein [Jatrophihabitantaceae bacterium]
MNRVRTGWVLLVVAAVAPLAGCTPSSGPPAPPDVTHTATQVITQAPTFVPRPARTVKPQPPGSRLPAGEVERRCPYIASTPDENPKVNVADIEGDHVYRTTVLTKLKPVGCRFYFYAPPFEAIADVVPHTFRTDLDAHNAMVLTATKTGTQAMGKPSILAGVDAVLYRTKFFGPDGRRDWACVFAKGKLMVVVHTQRSDTSLNALLLAKAIARRI